MSRNIKWNKSKIIDHQDIPPNAKLLMMKNEKRSMMITIILLVLLIVGCVEMKRSYQEFYFSVPFSLLGIFISVFPGMLLHEYIHALYFPKDVEVKITFISNGLKTKVNTFADCYFTKIQILRMLFMPSLLLGILPILLFLIPNNNIELSSFLFFIGIVSLAMACSDLCYFVFLAVKMPKDKLLIQSSDAIYIIER